jgi:hypothetical protein
MQFIVKIIVSAILIAAVSELGKRYSFFASILASLPLVSVLALIWLYKETNDIQKVTNLSHGIFWAVIPSLLLFIVLPLLLKTGFDFYKAMFLSCLITSVGYWVFIFILNKFGIRI